MANYLLDREILLEDGSEAVTAEHSNLVNSGLYTCFNDRMQSEDAYRQRSPNPPKG